MELALAKKFSTTAAKIALQTAVKFKLTEFVEVILKKLLENNFQEFDYTLEYAVFYNRSEETLKLILDLAKDKIQFEDLTNALRLSLKYRQDSLTKLLMNYDKDHHNGKAFEALLSSIQNREVLKKLNISSIEMLTQPTAFV